MEIRINKY